MKTPLKLFCLITAASFVCSLVTNAQDQKEKPTASQAPLILMQDVPFRIAIDNLARQAGINFTIDPKVIEQSSTPVNLRWQNMTAREALDRLLKERGLFLAENPQTSVLKITATNSAPRVFDKELFTSSKEVVPLITLMDTPLKVAFADLGSRAGLKLELDNELSSPSRPFKEQIFVSVRFENISASQAVAAICDQYNLQITKSEKPGTWLVSRGK